ncbi:MAG: hypothetical protein HRT65_04540 [Flavobacteriaceae bacterium]|nr:hypothetical protein [Flavobacteriaceae bacterium]
MQQLIKILTALLIKVVLIVLFLIPSNTEAQRRSTSVSVSNGGKTTISIKNGLSNKFYIEYKGDITLSDDDSDVVGISRGGYMEIKKSAFGNRRRIVIEPNDSGELVKKYYVGSSQRSFDAEGKKWLSEILLEVVRTTTLGSEKRVDRMYRQGGSYKVLKEVDKIASDHVKARYIKLLLDKDLKEKDLIAILNTVGEDFDSDHHKADILKRNAKAFLASDNTTAAYIKAASDINSDHHTAEVLKKSIRDGSISNTQMKALFPIVDDIDSDHHKASVLNEVLRERNLDAENTKLLIATSKSINSDHHKASVLKKALGKDLGSATSHALLASVSNMSSDHHIASVFLELVKQDLDASSKAHLLRLVEENMTSDNHQANVLKRMATAHQIDESLPDYLGALTNIDSDHHKADVFKTLSRSTFSEKQLIAILGATESIDSDYHKAETLIAFSSAVNGGSKAVADAYTDACMDIDSDSHLGRAIKAIN